MGRIFTEDEVKEFLALSEVHYKDYYDLLYALLGELFKGPIPQLKWGSATSPLGPVDKASEFFGSQESLIQKLLQKAHDDLDNDFPLLCDSATGRKPRIVYLNWVNKEMLSWLYLSELAQQLKPLEIEGFKIDRYGDKYNYVAATISTASFVLWGTGEFKGVKFNITLEQCNGPTKYTDVLTQFNQTTFKIQATLMTKEGRNVQTTLTEPIANIDQTFFERMISRLLIKY